MPFEKGKEKTGGREKGTLNKFTTLKQAFLDAFQDEEIGGKNGMVKVFSQTDLRKMEFFKLISKMLPSNMNVEANVHVTYEISDKFLPKMGDDKK